MTPQDILSITYKTSSMVLSTYLSDLSDDDLMHRPGPGCNHLAWQLGHLIASETMLLEMVQPGASAQIPVGFAEKYTKDTASNDSPAAFDTKEEFMRLLKANEEAALKAFANVKDSQLESPSPSHMQPMFPTVASILVLVSTHAMMHCGQFVPVRRALGKPILV